MFSAASFVNVIIAISPETSTTVYTKVILTSIYTSGIIDNPIKRKVPGKSMPDFLFTLIFRFFVDHLCHKLAPDSVNNRAFTAVYPLTNLRTLELYFSLYPYVLS